MNQMFLIKSGKKENMLQLQKEGKLHIGTLTHFAKSADEKRKDTLEGFLLNITKPYQLSIEQEGKYIPIARLTNVKY